MLMTTSIFSEGKEYISASRAAEKIGYASDYIGQLCRAKKIPGQLIGRTWYIDFAFLIEHKKNRQLGRVKKSLVSESKGLAGKGQTLNIDSQGLILKSETLENLTGGLQPANLARFDEASARRADRHDESSLISSPPILPQPSSKTTAGEPRYFNNPVFTYEKEEISRLPELSKKGRYVTPIWTSTLFKQMAAFSLALLIAVSAGFATLEYTTPSIAVEVRQRVENFGGAQKEFLVALSTDLGQRSALTTQIATVSFFDGVGKLFDSVVSSFRHLKELALNKIFFVRAPTKIAEIPPPLYPAQNGRGEAVAEVTRLLDLGSLKSELKIELESYIRLRIDALRPPVVVYSSSPSISSADLNAFKINEVIPITYNVVTRQSDSDSGRLSSVVSSLSDSLTNGGSFINATVSGPTGSFTNFSFGSAIGTQATTTNFFSTTASSTNLFSSLLTVGGTGLVVDSSRNVGIGTTSPSDTLALNGAMYIASISVPSVTANRIYNAGGDLYWAGNVIGGSTTGTWTTDGTNVWRAGGNVGISTTSPFEKFSVAGSAYIGGNLTATGTVSFLNGLTSLSNLLVTASTTLQNFTFVNATGTSATTTNLFSTTASTTNLFFTTGNGGNLTSTGLGTFGTLLSSGSSTLQNFTFVNATGTSATTTNFYSTTASSTNLFSSALQVDGSTLYVDSTNNRVGIGTTSPLQTLSVGGNAYFGGNIDLDNFSTYKLNGLTVLSATTTTFNTLAGLYAGANIVSTSTSNTSGLYNTALGYEALRYATSTDGNTAVGYQALRMNSGASTDNSGSLNSAFGYQALTANTTGTQNSAFGHSALLSNTTGVENSAFGINALQINTTGGRNSALGRYALLSNNASNNTALGFAALYSNTTGAQNSALGTYALYSNTTGGYNSAFGYSALETSKTGSNNSALGSYALRANTTGSNNSALGFAALYSNTTGAQNSALGTYALYSNTTGSNNSALGRTA
ncbi:MAG: hypothetical protein Q7S49_01840, partial [bacterium]|nr:hypothetical protein [bacterium]